MYPKCFASSPATTYTAFILFFSCVVLLCLFTILLLKPKCIFKEIPQFKKSYFLFFTLLLATLMEAESSVMLSFFLLLFVESSQCFSNKGNRICIFIIRLFIVSLLHLLSILFTTSQNLKTTLPVILIYQKNK